MMLPSELMKSITEEFVKCIKNNQLCFKKEPKTVEIFDITGGVISKIPYQKFDFYKETNRDVFVELYMDGTLYNWQNKVLIKTSNDEKLEDILSVNYFEFDGKQWTYFPAFDMEKLIDNFEEEYSKKAETLKPDIIKKIFDSLNSFF